MCPLTQSPTPAFPPLIFVSLAAVGMCVLIAVPQHTDVTALSLMLVAAVLGNFTKLAFVTLNGVRNLRPTLHRTC